MQDIQRYSIWFQPNEPMTCIYTIDLRPQPEGSLVKFKDFRRYKKDTQKKIRELEETIGILKQGGARPLLQEDLNMCIECEARKARDLEDRNDQISFMRWSNGLDEWECPECHSRGQYQEIRKPFDKGVDSCPDCGTEVNVIDFD